LKPVVVSAVAVFLALVFPSSVFSEDYIADTVQALQRSSVYVAPGTAGTDKDTSAKLQARLNQDDNIVLVMLPAKAEAELGAEAFTIASRLSEQLGDQRIIGLAVGNNVVGYAPSLPQGVASDQMGRARSVSNDTVTALGTFVLNIHTWQRDHPQPKLPISLPTQVNPSRGVPWVAVPSALAIWGVIWVIRRRQIMATSTERTRFVAPDPVKALLSKIAQERGQIRDQELQAMIHQLCVDIERYFRSSSKEKEKDTLFFRYRLTEVHEVLSKYLQVQAEPRYYYEPATELTRGKEAIRDFSTYVLEAIRRGQAATLMDYKVNTDILQAQRYR
jgi:hypothetical protein